ncbi:MAG TPA: hypothetical protein VFY53_07555 [Rhodoplanes sp.]|nr:hypothetical protein [Rhodoplanes sp.]
MTKSIVLVAALALTALGASQDARAQTAQQQAACQYDAQTYCSQYIPDHELIRRCLVRNRGRIGAACRGVLYGGQRRRVRSR